MSLAIPGLVTLLASLLTSCYYDPYAFQARSHGSNAYGPQVPANAYREPTATSQPPVAYTTPSQQERYGPVPGGTQPTLLGRRQGVYSVAQAPTATYQPAPNLYSTAPVSQTQPVDTRWNSGNTWATRQQGAKVNARGSGDAWRNRGLGQRRVPSPDTAPNWQSASVYPQTSYPAVGTTYQDAQSYQGSQYPSVGVGGSAFGVGVGAGLSGGTYTVRSGDNLSTIARNHGCSLSSLLQLNNLPSTVIHPGQVLYLPQ